MWKLIGGTAGIITSNDDSENDQRMIMPDETIHLNEGERHRLIGLDNWGIIAEIWQHSRYFQSKRRRRYCKGAG
jgi:hypothetical protein